MMLSITLAFTLAFIFWSTLWFAKKTDPFMERRRKNTSYFVFHRLLFFMCPYIWWKGGPLVSRSTKLERDFQSSLIKELKERFNGCIVLKNDSSYIQGIPDLLVLFEDKWAMLEVKRSSSAKRRPNQQYYVDLMDKMSFSRFICPENKEVVLHELEQAFKS